MYQLYDAFVQHLQTRDESEYEDNSKTNVQADQNYMDATLRIKVEFIYRPTISSQFVEDFHR